MRGWFDTIVSNANPGNGQTLAQKADFYDTVTSDITLVKLENAGEGRQFSPFEIEFFNAYPVRLGDLAMASDAYNQLMEFQVDFYYETYHYKVTKQETRGTF